MALADEPVLAAHLLGVAFFPFAVAGAAWHLLPVMLRNRLPSVRRLWLALALLGGGPVLAPGLAMGVEPLAWTRAGFLAAGLALALVDVAGLVLRAPRGKVLVASRTGVALSGFHAAAGFTLGAIAFGLGGASPLGVPYERLVLMHLVVAVLGWLTLLAGAVFLAEAGGLGLAALAGGLDARRVAVPASVLLVLGWAAGVVVGHVGKLLSLSAWVWWPPGPRPKQHALYARAVWQAEAVAFAAGSQVLAAGIVAGSEGAARSGAALVCVAAALALAGALETVRRALRRPG